jgi:hypothetical protein
MRRLLNTVAVVARGEHLTCNDRTKGMAYRALVVGCRETLTATAAAALEPPPSLEETTEHSPGGFPL